MPHEGIKQEEEKGNVELHAGPALSSYFALCGAWILLTMLNIAAAVNRRDPEILWVAAMTLGIGLAFAAWIRGHRIRVEGGKLEYRDGFYRKRECLLDDVISVDYSWLGSRRTGSRGRIPQMALILSSSPDAPIVINPKPFRLDDLGTLRALLRRPATRPPRDGESESSADDGHDGSGARARFSPRVEAALRAGGWEPGSWEPGSWSEEEAAQFEFPLHEKARQFICEFSDVDLGKGFWFAAKCSNRESRYFNQVARMGLKNCVPVAESWTWGEESVWMDEEGAMYLAGGGVFIRVADSPEEGLELFLFPRPLAPNMPSWKLDWAPLPWQEGYGEDPEASTGKELAPVPLGILNGRNEAVSADYPYYDYVWIACDTLGRVGAFVTGGRGPIPASSLEATSIPIGDIEDRVLEMPIHGEGVMKAGYQKPVSFVALAQRGLFVFDWSDVHRAIVDELRAYERVGVPSAPVLESALSPELQKHLASVTRFKVNFEAVGTFDPRAQTVCVVPE